MNIRTDFTRLELVLLVSCVVVGLGAFLPWVTGGVPVGPAGGGPTATGIEGLGIVTLALAIVGSCVLVLEDVEDLTPVATVAIGASVLLIGLWRMIDLGGPVSPGIGLSLTVLGGLGITGVGAWTYQVEANHSTPKAID